MNSCFPSYKHPDHVKAEPVLGSEAKKGDTGPLPLGTRYVLGAADPRPGLPAVGKGGRGGQGVQRKLLRGRGTRRASPEGKPKVSSSSWDGGSHACGSPGSLKENAANCGLLCILFSPETGQLGLVLTGQFTSWGQEESLTGLSCLTCVTGVLAHLLQKASAWLPRRMPRHTRPGGSVSSQGLVLGNHGNTGGCSGQGCRVREHLGLRA